MSEERNIQKYLKKRGITGSWRISPTPPSQKFNQAVKKIKI